MNTHAEKSHENKNQPAANESSQRQSGGDFTFQLVDNCPEAIAQGKLQEMANNSPQMKQLRAIQEAADNSKQAKQAAQLQANADNYSTEQHKEKPLISIQGNVYQLTPKVAGDICTVKEDATLRERSNPKEDAYTKVKSNDVVTVISGNSTFVGYFPPREYVLIRTEAGLEGYIRDTNITRKLDGEYREQQNLVEITATLKFARRELFKAHYAPAELHDKIRQEGIKANPNTLTNSRWGYHDKNLNQIKQEENARNKWNYDSEKQTYDALYYFDRPSTSDIEDKDFKALGSEFHPPSHKQYGDRLIFLQDDEDEQVEHLYDAYGNTYGTTMNIRNKRVLPADILPNPSQYQRQGKQGESEFDPNINVALDPYIKRIIAKSGMTVEEVKGVLINEDRFNFFSNLLYNQ